MKRLYIKPSIQLVGVEAEAVMLRASYGDTGDGGGETPIKPGGDIWIGSKDNAGSLWEDDDYDYDTEE